MIKAGQIDNNTFLLIKGTPYAVVERQFVNPGKGSAFCRMKLKSLKDGKVLKETYKTQDSLEDISVTDQECQYLYCDDENYYFMKTADYEQFEIPITGFEEKKFYIKDGETYKVVFWDEKPIDIKIPMKVIFNVVDAPEAIRGDTATNVTKIITTETGLKVKAPFFIKEGEKVLVNSETNEYVERVND